MSSNLKYARTTEMVSSSDTIVLLSFIYLNWKQCSTRLLFVRRRLLLQSLTGKLHRFVIYYMRLYILCVVRNNVSDVCLLCGLVEIAVSLLASRQSSDELIKCDNVARVEYIYTSLAI